MKKGWDIKKLREVCDFQNGFAFKSKLFTEEGLPILRISNIQQEKISFNRLVYFNKDNYDIEFEKFKVEKGDLVIAMSGATTGKLAISNSEKTLYLNQRVGKFKPNESLLKEFLYHYLTTRIEENLKISLGSAQPNLSTEQIKNFILPLPPLSEQKRIVKILDETFAAIDKAKANAEKNLQNSRELFESYLNEVFANPGDDWAEKRLEEVSNIINGYSFSSTDFSANNEIKSIKITNVGIRGFVEDSSNKLPVGYEEAFKKYLINSGDIVIALTRTIISGGLKVAIVPSSFNKALLNQRVAAIKPNPKQLLTNFLFGFLSTFIVLNYVKSKANTLMQPNLSIFDLKNLKIPLPNIIIQKQVVEKLEEISSESKNLESIYQQKLADLVELKKSILHKAFDGAL